MTFLYKLPKKILRIYSKFSKENREHFMYFKQRKFNTGVGYNSVGRTGKIKEGYMRACMSVCYVTSVVSSSL